MKEEKKKKEEYKELPLGLNEEKGWKLLLRKVKKKAKLINTEVKYSGVYNNFWLWNIIFLNLSISFFSFFLISKNYSILPSQIGLNIYGLEELDTVINKDYLFILPAIHIIIAFYTFAFSIRSDKRLYNLFILAFLNYLVLGFFEFFALRNLINYFVI